MADDHDCCEKVFTIDRKMHAQNRQFITKMTEFGGDSHVDYDSFVIAAKSHAPGKYDSVKVPDGTVTWHSHPGKCLNRNACAVGLPSPVDLYNIYASVRKGVIWHLVYSKEGVFAIKCRQDYRDAIKAESPEILPALKQRVMKDFVALHNRFKRSRQRNYRAYTHEWFRLAERHGFMVKFFSGNKVPKLVIRYPCKNTTQKSKRSKAPPRSQWV